MTSDLQTLEARIRSSALDAAEALREIHDRELWRPKFKNFVEYCEKRWGWSKSHAYRLIQASETAKALPAQFSPIGAKEGVLRELRAIPEESRQAVAERVVENGDVTIRGVQDAAAAVMVLDLSASEASFGRIQQLHGSLASSQLEEWAIGALETMRQIGLFIQEVVKKKHLNRSQFIRWRDRVPDLTFDKAKECVRIANKFNNPISNAKDVAGESDAILRVAAGIGERHREVQQQAATTPSAEIIHACCSARVKIERQEKQMTPGEWAAVMPELRALRGWVDQMIERHK